MSSTGVGLTYLIFEDYSYNNAREDFFFCSFFELVKGNSFDSNKMYIEPTGCVIEAVVTKRAQKYYPSHTTQDHKVETKDVFNFFSFSGCLGTIFKSCFQIPCFFFFFFAPKEQFSENRFTLFPVRFENRY